MFRALDFPKKGVFSSARTRAEFHSERQFGFGDHCKRYAKHLWRAQ